MPKSAKQATYEQQPNYTQAIIESAIKSPSANSFVWLVAEDVDDARVYRRMYDPSIVKAYPSTDKQGHRSCINVELIVSHFYQNGKSKRVVGIRDKDYTSYVGHSVSPPVFTTDERDIEMQMLISPGIVSKMSSMCPQIQSLQQPIKVFLTRMGYYRIFNDENSFGFCFDGCLGRYWDYVNKAPMKKWENSFKRFFYGKIQHHTGWDVKRMIREFGRMCSSKNLCNKPYSEICQGHDFVSLLKTQVNSIFDQLDKDLFEWYLIDDFKNTRLARDIQDWATQNGFAMPYRI